MVSGAIVVNWVDLIVGGKLGIEVSSFWDGFRLRNKKSPVKVVIPVATSSQEKRLMEFSIGVGFGVDVGVAVGVPGGVGVIVGVVPLMATIVKLTVLFCADAMFMS